MNSVKNGGMSLQRRQFVLGALALSGVACGFKPRGSRTAAEDVGRLFVDTDRDISIARPLREALFNRDFDLAANRDQAQVILRITEERIEERIVSVQSAGRVSEFELSHAVDVAVQRVVDGEAPTRDTEAITNRVRVTREYTYDETEVLGKENEARILRDEMRNELVLQIVLRTLASLADSVA